MAGYTRQSVADIIANAVIKAAPVNAEYNAIRDAFAQATGHKHDGTSAEGAYVPLISDPSNTNKVVVDSTNNRISVYTEVSGVAVEQVRIQDGAIVPVTDDDIDLGASGAEFKDLYIDGIGYIDSVVITGGTIDDTVIGGTTPAAADFTNVGLTGNLSVTGTSTLTGTTTITTADINSGNIDNTVIGNTTPVAATFTTATTTGQAALATVNIDGGTIDNTTIGNTTPVAITGTLITATTNFSGPLIGAVTGNVTGNVTGDLTGDVTGNITASSGSSTFNDVTINGTLNMDAATTATITNLSTPVASGDAASKGYVDTEIASLVDSAPGTLDTLNELAAALGDDPDFATTVTDSIATKLPLAGGTMTGAIAMSTNKITGLGDPTANQDAATKNYTDTTFLGLAGGTMTGAIDMGSSKITTTYTPTDASDLTTKTYVDSILQSATAASASAANAATSESNAATSETNAATSEANAAASYDNFDDRFLGPKAAQPSNDNDGDPILAGALYFNTVSNTMYVYNGTTWQEVAPVNYGATFTTFTATAGQTSFSVAYDIGYVTVYLNGVKLLAGTDFTATTGSTVVLSTAAALNDIVDIVAFGTFTVADALDQSQADARYLQVSNDFSDLNSAATARTNLGVAIGTDVQAYSSNLDSVNQNLSTTSDVTFSTITAGFTATTADQGLLASTFSVDIDEGQIQTVTLGGNITVNSTSLADGDQLILMINDGSAYTVTWSGFVWANNDGVAPTLVTTGYNTFIIWKINGTTYITYAGDQ
jgi:hypothetical protein